jgi:8-amino-7-oxononanoate synthase
LLDDAHGFGVLGSHGAGTLSHLRARSDRVIYMGTLGKAAGVCGAFVAGSTELIEYLVNRARSYIYTTALPALLAAALVESIRILRTEDWRREHLVRLIAELRHGIDPRCGTLLESHTAIQPLVVGSTDAALRLSRALYERGFLVPAIRPPTVPRGSARLRISLSAAHRLEDVRALTTALREVSA